jgi:16S rRNA (adenine1518-N6/adenine1519-N6)-dimethyltransferase
VPRPKLGQHFLSRGSILERIAAAACPAPQDLVVEIGPGRGSLTEKLLQRSARVVAVEVDPLLVERLHLKFASEPRLEIVCADVLQTDLAQWGGATIAGNLPYYIASPILEKVLPLNPPRAVFLIQKEVAGRLVAHPGGHEYGYLTVRTALFARCRLLFEVKPAAFHPPPKVDSAVVLLEPRTCDPDVPDRDAFLRFVAQCFRQRRKTLRNNLAALYGKDRVDAWPEVSLRAQQISLEGFIELFRRLQPPATLS